MITRERPTMIVKTGHTVRSRGEIDPERGEKPRSAWRMSRILKSSNKSRDLSGWGGRSAGSERSRGFVVRRREPLPETRGSRCGLLAAGATGRPRHRLGEHAGSKKRPVSPRPGYSDAQVLSQLSTGPRPGPMQEESQMGMITKDHRELIEEVGLCYVASTSADGVPNVSPKGSIAVLDDDHLVFAEIMSPHTRQNLEENPRV